MPLAFDERYKRGRAIEKELNLGVLQGSSIFNVEVTERRARKR